MPRKKKLGVKKQMPKKPRKKKRDFPDGRVPT
jgi:hypothetical protein